MNLFLLITYFIAVIVAICSIYETDGYISMGIVLAIIIVFGCVWLGLASIVGV